MRHLEDPPRAWVIDGCGNSGPISRSEDVLAQIKSMKANTAAGVVNGMISTDSLTTGVPDVVVKTIGKGRTFSTKTDQAGRFTLRLPTGKYTLEASRPGRSFAPEPLGYESPENLNILPGYCAQVQFSSAEK